jgi:hypothetical protein
LFPLSREASSSLGITSPQPTQKLLLSPFYLFTMTTPETQGPVIHSPERGRSPGPPTPGVHRRTQGGMLPPPPQGIEEQSPSPPLPPGPPPPQRSPSPPGPLSRQSSQSSVHNHRKSKQQEQGRKPDPFTNKSQYCIFQQQLYLYLQQNPNIYPNDINKVQFTLGFFTEGLPAEWAFLFIEKVAKKNKEKKPEPWGTWEEFYNELEIVFGDPNENQNELTRLENLTMKTGQTATEFFQEFDLYALHADYMKNEEILICMAEKKIPKQLVHSMFNCGKPPTVYQTLLRVVF